MNNNPFSVQTPETMSPQEVVDLFVPLGESYNIEEPGHSFVHGHRGCGKSMMFRLMSPECQTLHLNKELPNLPYYGVYLSIKATSLNIKEFSRLEGQTTGYILSENTLINYIVTKILKSLADYFGDYIDANSGFPFLVDYCEKYIFGGLRRCGWTGTSDTYLGITSSKDLLDEIASIFENLHAETIQYLKRIMLTSNSVPFSGVLLGFQDFLLPVMKGLKHLPFMPSKPIYLLLDDADNLNRQQTEVLNTWVSYRLTDVLSLKISTQLAYKTYKTVNGQRIESPHDYSEVNVSSVHTGSNKDSYPQWVSHVVQKRLLRHQITVSPAIFFPPDEDQEKAIDQIYEELMQKWEKFPEGGSRARDYAYRNARPEYIKRLLGQAKNGPQYKYAGFEKQLIHLSSGIIRFFLEPASQMFSEEQKRCALENIPLTYITPSIQDKVIRETANQIMFNEFDKISSESEDEEDEIGHAQLLIMRKLRNLILTIGAMFQRCLLSEDSERRVFSFAISDEPDKEIREVLKLGIQFGYFYESAIGTKEGMGRTKLYVMSRRLAPFFKLDPTGFSAHKFVTSNFLRAALERPKATQNALKRHSVDDLIDNPQKAFDFDGE